jgi:hypothetical protein
MTSGKKKFDANYLFRFHLARYACQAGRLEEARLWLWRANQLGRAKDIAFDEPYFEPIWEYVDSLEI